jgi:hypothetical protein
VGLRFPVNLAPCPWSSTLLVHGIYGDGQTTRNVPDRPLCPGKTYPLKLDQIPRYCKRFFIILRPFPVPCARDSPHRRDSLRHLDTVPCGQVHIEYLTHRTYRMA